MKKWHMGLLVLAVMIAIAFLALSATRMTALQGTFLNVSSPAIKAGSSLTENISKLNKGLKTLDELEAEVASLTVQNNELRATNQQLVGIEQENSRLREALGYSKRSEFKLLPAEVLTRDAASWWSTVKINRGFADGVDSSQPILMADGLVGRTLTVAKDISIVMLLTDENSQVAVRIEGSNEQGIISGHRVTGNAQPELILNFLSRDANLQPGMKIFTAGVSGAIFPAGILVGEVKEFRPRELDGQAIVTPSVDFSRLEDVFVVLGGKK